SGLAGVSWAAAFEARKTAAASQMNLVLSRWKKTMATPPAIVVLRYYIFYLILDRNLGASGTPSKNASGTRGKRSRCGIISGHENRAPLRLVGARDRRWHDRLEWSGSPFQRRSRTRCAS